MALNEQGQLVGTRDAWLAQVNEPALQPTLPIVDPRMVKKFVT